MRQARPLILVLLFTAATATPALADATLFIGSTPTPSNRPTLGAAIGMSLAVVGFEFGDASARQEQPADAPGLTTIMVNAFVQTPLAIAGFQPYATAGTGGYRESLGTAQETHLATNVGGGVKVSLAGPLRMRFDYRLIRLLGDPQHDLVHRVYAGANVAF